MKNATKLTLLLLLAASGVLLAFAGAQPDALKTVSQVVESGDSLVGSHVELKATVKTGTFNATETPVRFHVTDDVHDLAVVWPKAFPVDSEMNPEGRTIVIKGVITQAADGSLILVGDDVIMGCPSKYEANESPTA